MAEREKGLQEKDDGATGRAEWGGGGGGEVVATFVRMPWAHVTSKADWTLLATIGMWGRSIFASMLHTASTYSRTRPLHFLSTFSG
jgi:hypothetical protein